MFNDLPIGWKCIITNIVMIAIYHHCFRKL